MTDGAIASAARSDFERPATNARRIGTPDDGAFKKLTGKSFAGLDASTAAKTLRRARDHSIGAEGGVVIVAVLEMAHADQARFIAAFDKATGIAPGRGQLAGGLLVQTAAPAKFVAAAPADHLATGAATPKESAVTVSLDSVTETHRNWNFVDKNYKQVVGARLGHHTLRGTEPRTLAGTDLENEIGVAMGEQISHNRHASSTGFASST